MQTTGPGWSFDDIVVQHARESPDLLDMGTGGGEWLSKLAFRPRRTVATEAWPPNVDVARGRLAPLGIDVVAVEPAPDNIEQERDERRGHLPFSSESFSLVVNRHESFAAAEVARVLRPAGAFLTQQVGGDYGEFYDALGLPRSDTGRLWDRELATGQLEAAGLDDVDGADGSESVCFRDVGAFAWYLQAIPWVVEGFRIDD
jgi:SAM-dependent methyltransferase